MQAVRPGAVARRGSRGSAQLEVGCQARGGRRLARRSHPDPRGPDSDAALGSHDVRATGRSEFRKRPNWRALRSGLPYAARADVRMGPNESAPVTEGAVLHNGAGGRAFAAIGDLRLVGCRAAGRASR
jgi:hypothetical protein